MGVIATLGGELEISRENCARLQPNRIPTARLVDGGRQLVAGLYQYRFPRRRRVGKRTLHVDARQLGGSIELSSSRLFPDLSWDQERGEKCEPDEDIQGPKTPQIRPPMNMNGKAQV